MPIEELSRSRIASAAIFPMSRSRRLLTTDLGGCYLEASRDGAKGERGGDFRIGEEGFR